MGLRYVFSNCFGLGSLIVTINVKRNLIGHKYPYEPSLSMHLYYIWILIDFP